MSPAEWSSSTYYLMYCHPYDTFHMLGVNIATPEGGTLRFRINRPKTAPAFSEADRALCDLLVPHLRRAMHIYSRLDRTASHALLQAISRPRSPQWCSTRVARCLSTILWPARF